MTDDLRRRAEALFERYRSPAVLLNRPYPPHSPPAGNSHFGGLPALPHGLNWPRTSTGIPLHFLCQVDCREIGWQTALPERGMLFFFGRDDAEQIWGEGPPGDDCRVLHTPDPPNAHATEPPPDLPPIGWDYPRSSFRDVALEGDPDRSLHPKWPIQPLPIATYPDRSGLPPLIAHHLRAERRFMREYKTRKLLRTFLPRTHLFPQAGNPSKDEPVWDLYGELLPQARAQALEAATGAQVAERETAPAEYLASERMFEDEAFPTHWIFIHYFARLALRRYRRTGLNDHPLPTADELAAIAQSELQLDGEARAWFDRACAEPLQAEVREEDRREFRHWAAAIQRRAGDELVSSRGLEWSRGAATWAIREWAGEPDLAGSLSPLVYESRAGYFQLNSVERGEDKDWYHFQYSQMIGHAPASQEAASADSSEVCLLNLASDRGLGWTFGDAGACTFWIDRGDLAARNFSRVRGTIEGG